MGRERIENLTKAKGRGSLVVMRESVSGGEGGSEVRAVFDRVERAYVEAIWVEVQREEIGGIRELGIPQNCVFDFGNRLKMLLYQELGITLYGENGRGGAGNDG